MPYQIQLECGHTIDSSSSYWARIDITRLPRHTHCKQCNKQIKIIFIKVVLYW